MDINSLLSPQKSPRETPSPSSKSPAKKLKRPKAFKSANTTQSTSPSNSPLHQSLFPHDAMARAQHTATSPPRRSPASGLKVNATRNPPADSIRAVGKLSTPGMDALADVASMQHHRNTPRTNAGGLRGAEIYESHTLSAVQMTNVNSKPSKIEFSKAEASNPKFSPRQFSSNSLSEEELETVAQLYRNIDKNPFAYESHVQLVKLLHQGLVAHIHADSSSGTRCDPRTYDLLHDLQGAREVMNSTFAMGEDLWMDWIQDQKLLAYLWEDRITVVESCRKAVEEESGSMRLWLLYADWMLSLYRIGNPQDPMNQVAEQTNSQGQVWSEEDKMMAQEICSWEHMLEVWRQGAQDTKWRINDSHLLWDPYTEFLLEDCAKKTTEEGIRSLKAHFLDRLQTPHATWDQTFQSFSNFVSRFLNASYEDTMVTANKKCSAAKKQYTMRENFESILQRAEKTNDIEGEWRAFDEYIVWEKARAKEKNQAWKKTAFTFELINSLYQRATLRFPTDTQFWECYVVFLNEEIATQRRLDVSVMTVLERATSHCPWSGTLWSQHILAAERSNYSVEDVGKIKHKATSTGLLDAGDMADILRVHTAWCGFLRRAAFHPESPDDSMDVAEVGIRSAIEDMERIGREKYGKNYKGDAEYRLERIYIRYLSQCQSWQLARDAWNDLIPKNGDRYDFWLRYYMWEMSISDKPEYAESELNGSRPPKPMEATKVLHRAMKRPTLDWPEKIMEVYQYHCEDHESVEELQSAVVNLWKTKILVKRRRERENKAYELAQLQVLQQQQPHTQPDTLASHINLDTGKRKREDEIEAHGQPIGKKVRPDDHTAKRLSATIPLSAPSKIKRDRENATVIVKNLPLEITETRIRQYFRDVSFPFSGHKML